jgi:signal transduction histidine kinase
VNLLSNAVKFTFKGFIKISAEEEVNNYNSLQLLDATPSIYDLDPYYSSSEPNRKKIIISVEDSGIGIKDEDKDKLFKIFGKLENAECINPSGIGLGLTICNKILAQMGSELKVASKFGNGSKFFFRISLPIVAKPQSIIFDDILQS